MKAGVSVPQFQAGIIQSFRGAVLANILQIAAAHEATHGVGHQVHFEVGFKIRVVTARCVANSENKAP